MGTILVLLITVIIFSSILVWVYSLPAPDASTRVSMAGSLDPVYVGGVWQGAEVRLTHLGGENLNEGSTRVYLTIDNRTHALSNRGLHFDGVSVKPYGIEG
ncbi:MAG: type IV pilin N-terminal domain-containing protein, partial [Candidatus Methylomirabilales bacterium]